MTTPLDIFAAPLDAINLVEASAGTGKTYAIAGLYLRLLVEQGYRPGGILVVTYTRAATEELKDRIRSRLLETRQAFQQERDQDAFCRAMLERYQDRRQAIRRLNNALLAFDEAAIFTIHGFCQRVLSDSAFASGMPLASEILADDAEVLQEIVEDFWRRQFCDLPPRWANHVIAAKLEPATLQKTIRSHLNKPYLKIAELAAIEDLTQAEFAFEQTFEETRRLWLEHRQEVEELLLDSTDLDRRIFKIKEMPNWFIAVDEYLNLDDEPNPRLPDKFVKFTLSTITDGTKKDHTAPHHLFFEACEELNATAQQLQAGLEHYLLRLRHDLLRYCNEELPHRKRRRQVQSYDDLLLNLHAALTDPRRGPSLAESVRGRFPAALIDEFQDTDPTQYAIFQSIYQDSSQPVFLVGDPKQAIYSFRGADIFAYLGARQDAGQEHTLAENWRSDPDLVQAVNHLFSHRQRSFLLEQIGFTPVRAAAGEGARLVANDGTDAPLPFWFVPQETDGKPRNKTDANPIIARAVAGRIATLLTMAQQGTATIIEQTQQARPLNGGDIAVLVRSHEQAGLIRRTLLALGVVSVQHSRTSVFATAEAVELERLLQAVADPTREDPLRAALLTELCGVSADALYGLMLDEAAWESILYEFADYHRVWREEGFIQMFRAFLLRRDGYRRLLSFRDGERRLTNVLHLAELLQAASLREHLGLAGLVKWLAEQRQADEVENEAIQLRLESDAQLVKIVTIHKSKGLEYPIVFCPFLWDGKLYAEKASMIAFHDPDDRFQPVLDPGSPQLDANRPHAVREELAENLRLTYVALTRARHRCYVVWGGVKDAEKSALAWLLYDPPVIDPNKTDIEAQRDYVGKLNNAALLKPLDELAAQSGGAIHVSLLPVEPVAPYHPGADREPVLAARTFAGQIRTGRRFTSFSALQERRSTELPDYDPAPEPGPPAGEGRSIFTFPRGTRAGTCLHAIFENIDFTGPSESITSTAAEILRQYGFEEEWTDIVALMVDQVRHTPLDEDGGLKLSLVKPEQRLTELDFMYPFDHLDVKRLRSLLGGVDEIWEERLQTLDFRLLEGFMRGFIDLVFEHQGRYYLVDYKSNWLGPGLDDYRPPRVAAVMADGGYHLQYLIYTVAVHRYLRRRLPGYDYDRHFGGVRYLFLRGMRPNQGLNSGVFAERPTRELIEALDRYMAGQ